MRHGRRLAPPPPNHHLRPSTRPEHPCRRPPGGHRHQTLRRPTATRRWLPPLGAPRPACPGRPTWRRGGLQEWRQQWPRRRPRPPHRLLRRRCRRLQPRPQTRPQTAPTRRRPRRCHLRSRQPTRERPRRRVRLPAWRVRARGRQGPRWRGRRRREQAATAGRPTRAGRGRAGLEGEEEGLWGGGASSDLPSSPLSPLIPNG